MSTRHRNRSCRHERHDHRRPASRTPRTVELSQRRLWLKSWLLTTDHKRIAMLYLISITFMFFLGGLAATLIRLNLLTPTGKLVTPTPTTSCSPLHGIIMVFFFLIPSIPAVLGNSSAA